MDPEKELIIKSIAQRIKDEQRKHENNIENWHEIAARKIYASFEIKINISSSLYCHCDGPVKLCSDNSSCRKCKKVIL